MLSIFDSSLLVYTADNTLTHFLISTSLNGKASLRLCGSIGFEGVIRDPQRVRGISWLVPRAQHSSSRLLAFRNVRCCNSVCNFQSSAIRLMT